MFIWLGSADVLSIPFGAASNNVAKTVQDRELLYLLFLMVTFLPAFFGILAIVKLWHGRAWLSVLTYTEKFRWGHMWRAIGIGILAYIITLVIKSIFFPQELAELTRNTDLSVMIPGLLIIALLVPFQAASEEFLLRGYLNQALIKYVKSPWLVFVITSAAFAALHLSNNEAEGQLWPYMAAIFSFGIAACALLYFEGGIESAIGLHIINNIFVFGIIGYEDENMPEVALFYSGKPQIDWTMVAIESVNLALIVTAIIWANRTWGRS